MTQEEALTILKTGANVFLTGEPGSGKTHTINQYIAYLRECGVSPSVTASTGIAATHVSGMTIHAWSGIGIKKTLSGYDLEELATREPLVKRLVGAKVLIIDEISMLDGKILTLVDRVCREVRRRYEESFGGLQVVFVGDFFQLPPVNREGDGEMQFCFESEAWKEANVLICYLSEQHRQDDEVYLSVLSSIRRNQVEDGELFSLQERYIRNHTEAGTATKLYSHNADVDRMNSVELGKLKGESKKFQMIGTGNAKLVERLKQSCLSPEILELKEEAVVMFTKNNFEKGYVNGTLGTVIGFTKEGDFPIIETVSGATITVEPNEWAIEEDGKVKARVVQIPLRLAWAITIHKSQGMSLDRAVIDLSGAFEYGQGYVALSRVRSRAGLFLLGMNARALEVHPKILEVDGGLRERSQNAVEYFEKLSKTELATMQQNFLTSIGGKIASTKKEKTVVKVKDPNKKSFIEVAREKNPNAFRRWNTEEELFLKQEFEKGVAIEVIAEGVGRRVGGVIMRLKKLGVLPEEYEHPGALMNHLPKE